MPNPAMCELTGEVLGPNGEGLAEAGTYIACTLLSVPGYALESSIVHFYVDAAGLLKTKETGGQPAKLPQGATVRIRGDVLGFTNGANVSIPALGSYDFRLLVPPATPATDGVSQTAFNAHTSLIASPTALGHVKVPAENIAADGLLIFPVVSAEVVQDHLAAFFNSLTPALSFTYNDAQNRVDVAVANASGAQAGLMSAADKTALDAIPSTYQPLDSDLTAIAGLAPSNDDVLQRKAGAWVSRTPAQLKTDLAIAAGDVSGLTATIDARAGVTLQPLDAELTALAGLNSAADKAPYFTGSGAASLFDLTAFARTLLDDADAGTARTTLGLGSANSPTFTGLALSGLTAGRIPFAGTGGLLDDDAALVWDDTNKRLGVGRATPNSPLDIQSNSSNEALRLYTNAATGVAQVSFFDGTTLKHNVRLTSTNERLWRYGSTDLMALTSAGMLGVNKPTGIGAQVHIQAKDVNTVGLCVDLATGAQAVRPFKVRSAGGAAELMGATKLGNVFVRANGAPADADVLTSELHIYFDDTVGSSKVMFKGKNSAGTVVTGSVNLA